MTATMTPAPGCGPMCGCTSSTPIACTLGADDLRTRVAAWDTMLGDVTDRRPIDGGLRLTFSPDVDASELARLTAAELGCCAFYRFALTFDERGTALEVTAPDDAAVVLTSLFGGGGVSDATGRPEIRRRRVTKDAGGIIGLGAAACVACCAGPILAFLGGASILGFASTTVIGIAGLVIGAAALVAFLVVRSRRRTGCAVPTEAEAVPVAPPRRLTRTP